MITSVATLLNTLIYAGIGIVVFVIGFVILDILTPGKLWRRSTRSRTAPWRPSPAWWRSASRSSSPPPFMAEPERPARPRRASAPAAALLASAFVVATCGLVYELLASTLASYLLGDSVTQFSTVIGSYLFAMGIGSWFSRYVTGTS